MRVRVLGLAGVCAATALTSIVAWPAQAAPGELAPTALAFARAALPADDGWAAEGAGTSGGSAADADHVFVVHNRAELVAALGGNNATNGTNASAKIIFIAGTIDGNVDDNNAPLTCADYADPAFSLDQYLATYDPSVWGRVTPSGPLEEARVRSARNQSARVRINVGSNTTIFGLRDTKFVGANLIVNNVSNVIVRNVAFEDAYDCFPSWDPNDGAEGNWNSLYDTVSLTGSNHVWFDHDTFSDGNHHDADQPRYFGRPFQIHDGLLDITRASDFVTVEYCVFHDHDKTMLIGSTNTVGADVGHLRVTLHHNRFANVGQRAPRVRFGQVDVYDNYYVITDEDSYSYSWGVGVFSAIYAENNFVLHSADVPLDAVVFNWGGTAMTEVGTVARIGTQPPVPVSLLAAFNAAHDPDIGDNAGWTPVLRNGPLTPTMAVPAVVTAFAGAGKLPT